MGNAIIEALGGDRYEARWQCLGDDRTLIWLYFSADIVMFVAALSIAHLLFRVHWTNAYLSPRGRMLAAVFFAIFGVSTLSRAIALFWPTYRLDVIILGALAGVAASLAAVMHCQLLTQLRGK
jgi:hypothetical protein